MINVSYIDNSLLVLLAIIIALVIGIFILQLALRWLVVYQSEKTNEDKDTTKEKK